MHNTITFKSGLFEVTMTEEEVKKLYEDMTVMTDAYLVLLAKKDLFDVPHSPEDCKKYAREIIEENGGWNKDFLNEIFN